MKPSFLFQLPSDTMDIGAITSNTAIIDTEEDDRAFIEISELDRLLGLPPPRFDLGAADIVPLRVRSSAGSSSLDPGVEFSVPLKSSSPQQLDPAHKYKTDTEVSFSNKLANISVIKSELNIGSDGQELETECNSYLVEHSPNQPLSPTSNQGKSMACCLRLGLLTQVLFTSRYSSFLFHFTI